MKKLSKQQRLLQIQTKRLLIFAWAVMIVCLVAWYGLTQTLTVPMPQRLVTIYDRGIKRSVLTEATTVANALKAADITIDPRDVVEPSIDTKLTTSDADIIIYRSRIIGVVDGHIRQTVMTAKQSPNEMLKEAGLPALGTKDTTTFQKASSMLDEAPTELVVSRAEPEPEKPAHRISTVYGRRYEPRSWQGLRHWRFCRAPPVRI